MNKSIILYRAAGPMFWAGEEAQKYVYGAASLAPYQLVVIDINKPDWLRSVSPNAMFVQGNPYDWDDAFNKLKVASNKYGLEYIGIVTFAEETYIQYSKCANALNLTGPSITAAQCTSANKINMKSKFIEFGIPTPEYIVADDISQLSNKVKSFGFPCVIKPAVGGGSIGVYLVKDLNEMNAQICQLKYDIENKIDITFINDIPGFLIERFISGEVVSVDGICNGKTKIFGMTGTVTSDPPYFFQEAAFSPPVLDYAMEGQCQRIALNSLDSIKLNKSAFHCELIVDGNNHKPYVVELAGRSPGGYLPKLYEYTYTNDLISEILKLSIDPTQEYTEDIFCYRSKRFSLAGSCFLYLTGHLNADIADNIDNSMNTLVEYCHLPTGTFVGHFGFSIADGLFVGGEAQCRKDYKRFIEICNGCFHPSPSSLGPK